MSGTLDMKREIEKARIHLEVQKNEALNALARDLAKATTIEEARGIALLAFKGVLELIQP